MKLKNSHSSPVNKIPKRKENRDELLDDPFGDPVAQVVRLLSIHFLLPDVWRSSNETQGKALAMMTIKCCSTFLISAKPTHGSHSH